MNHDDRHTARRARRCASSRPDYLYSSRALTITLLCCLGGLIAPLTISSTMAAPEALVTVGGEGIDYKSFDECFKLRRANFKSDKISKSQKDRITFFAMKPFVDQLLVARELKRRGLSVDQTAVNARVAAIRKGFSSDKEFSTHLKKRMQTIKSLELAQWTKEASFVILSADGSIKPSEAEVKAKREEARARLKMPEQVRSRQLTIPLPDKATPEQINGLFKQIQEIHALILKEGKDFGIYVQRYSKGPLRGRNGDIGYASKGELDIPVEEALWALKDGEMSAPFRSRYGWHIIERMHTIPAHERPFNELRAKIEERLTQINFNKKYHIFIKSLWRNGSVKTSVELPPAYRAAEPVKQ